MGQILHGDVGNYCLGTRPRGGTTSHVNKCGRAAVLGVDRD